MAGMIQDSAMAARHRSACFRQEPLVRLTGEDAALDDEPVLTEAVRWTDALCIPMPLLAVPTQDF